MSWIREEIEKILPFVERPGRYIGNEVNIVRKKHSEVDAKVVFVYPDLYEIGMSNLGLSILYHIVNRERRFLAERSYMPWVDMEMEMRKNNIPLFSLENFCSLNKFDIVGFTLQTELCYTNVLNALDLSGIPLHAENRKEGDPIVVGGGPCASNPEPLAIFFDVFAIGDGEEMILEILEVVSMMKGKGRMEILRELDKIEGLYVPLFYQEEFDSNEIQKKIVRKDQKCFQTIKARKISELKEKDFPTRPLVPLVRTSENHFSIEIARGCGRSCLFCQASIVGRPLRERELDSIIRLSKEVLKSTGWEEITLLSLSLSDYNLFCELIEKISSNFREQRVLISMPSLRMDKFTDSMPFNMPYLKKGGLTFAPEAGSQKLREYLGKNMMEEDILRATETAFNNGWNQIKLYFMIGIPGEDDKDILEIGEMVKRIERVAKKYGNKKIKVSVNCFVPKPHTFFEREEQIGIQEAKRKLSILRQNLMDRYVHITWRDPEQSIIEGVLARGDRRVGNSIEKAWQFGAKFDEWSEHFQYSIWEKAFFDTGLNINFYLRKREKDEFLPWKHIQFLKRGNGLKRVFVPKLKFEKKLILNYGREKKRNFYEAPQAGMRFRLRYAKEIPIRFISHLDLINCMIQAFRRANIPVAYSHGYHPHMKLSMGPPLPLGMTSIAEYIDLELSSPLSAEKFFCLNETFPVGLRVLEVRQIIGKQYSLMQDIKWGKYLIQGLLEKREDIEDKMRGILVRNWKGKIKEISLEDNMDIYMVISIGSQGNMRPEGVLKYFEVKQEEIVKCSIKRMELYVERDGSIKNPMEILSLQR